MGRIIPESTSKPGLRERKRQQTRERIATAALTLFLERGFEATTVEEIAAAADVSKRSFFDYFPAKEDVVTAWQDGFSDRFAAALAVRPAGEVPLTALQEAMIETLVASADPQSMAIGRLIKETPALCARDHMKYARLELLMTDGLLARGGIDPVPARLLSMMLVGALRVGADLYIGDGASEPIDLYARRMFAVMRGLLA